MGAESIFLNHEYFLLASIQLLGAGSMFFNWNKFKHILGIGSMFQDQIRYNCAAKGRVYTYYWNELGLHLGVGSMFRTGSNPSLVYNVQLWDLYVCWGTFSYLLWRYCVSLCFWWGRQLISILRCVNLAFCDRKLMFYGSSRQHAYWIQTIL